MHPRFQAAFSQLAENLQSALAPVLADAHFPALLTADQVTALKQATGLDEDALAFALLPLAAACARADLSHAANRPRGAERHQSRLAARRKSPARHHRQLYPLRPLPPVYE